MPYVRNTYSVDPNLDFRRRQPPGVACMAQALVSVESYPVRVGEEGVVVQK